MSLDPEKGEDLYSLLIQLLLCMVAHLVYVCRCCDYSDPRQLSLAKQLHCFSFSASKDPHFGFVPSFFFTLWKHNLCI